MQILLIILLILIFIYLMLCLCKIAKDDREDIEQEEYLKKKADDK